MRKYEGIISMSSFKISCCFVAMACNIHYLFKEIFDV